MSQKMVNRCFVDGLKFFIVKATETEKDTSEFCIRFFRNEGKMPPEVHTFISIETQFLFEFHINQGSTM